MYFQFTSHLSYYLSGRLFLFTVLVFFLFHDFNVFSLCIFKTIYLWIWEFVILLHEVIGNHSINFFLTLISLLAHSLNIYNNKQFSNNIYIVSLLVHIRGAWHVSRLIVGYSCCDSSTERRHERMLLTLSHHTVVIAHLYL